MPLGLTAYGTSAGYALSKLCDHGSFQAGSVPEQLRTYIARRGTDAAASGYHVHTKSLSNDNDGQSAPGNPTMSVSSNNFVASSDDYTILLTGTGTIGSFSCIAGMSIERVTLSDYSVSSGFTTYTPGSPLGFVPGTFSGLTFRGVADRASNIAYVSGQLVTDAFNGSSNQFYRVFTVDLTTGTASVFFDSPSFSLGSNFAGLLGIAFDGQDATAIYLVSFLSNNLGTVADYTLSKYRIADQMLLDSWTLSHFDTSTYPSANYGVSSVAFLRGTGAGKVLVSGLERTDALNAALYVAEFDLNTDAFNVIARTATRGNSTIRGTYLYPFGDYLLLGDTQGASNAQMTRITLPAGTEAGNEPDSGGGGGDTGTPWSRGETPTTGFDRGGEASCDFSRSGACSTVFNRGGRC